MTDAPIMNDATIIKPLEFHDAFGSVRFEPQPDITGYEAALINQMLARMIGWMPKKYDWREYLSREWHVGPPHGIVNLMRHFVKI